jgi:hypothetical protein
MLKYFIPLLLLFTFTQCQQEVTYTNPEAWGNDEGINFGQEFSLQQYEQIILFGGETPRRLYLTLKQINDSRCPANANCVQAGNANITLTASNSQGKDEKIELCIGDCGNGSIRETHTVIAPIGEASYEITLKHVKPYPGLAHEGEVKKAVLVVKRR